MLVHTTNSYRPASRKRKPLPRKPRKAKAKFEVYVPPKTYVRETPNYPSLETGKGIAERIEPQKYTGTLVKGIATMHKSNAVPVINEEEAKDIANMRRTQ